MTTKPKTRKAPTANAWLPAIDRRALVCGLGTAAVAGGPALGSVASMSDDPVFQAMAALEQLKIQAEKQDVAHSVAEDALFAAMEEYAVTVDGKEMRTHEQIEVHFLSWLSPEDEENIAKRISKKIGANLESALSPEDKEQFKNFFTTKKRERDQACQAAHDELARKEAKKAEVEQRIGYREIEARKDTAERAVWDPEYDVMEAEPATTAGAVALLRFVADLMESLFLPNDDEHERYIGAMRNAAGFFERNASA